MSRNTYQRIKELAKEAHISIADLLALAPNNDPFYAGAPAQQAQADWFADLWRRFGYRGNVHLRRVHYQLVSQEDAQRHDGQRYENTENCWNYLCQAGKAARYLGLVSAEAFVDRRNPDPHIYADDYRYDENVRWRIDVQGWELPQINTDLAADIDLRLPEPSISGYSYSAANQPYHIEVWVEKSTMDDVLTPVCRRLGLNLVTSLGFQSITSVITLLRRIEAAAKPARIFYISDYDPAGDGMPVAVARQVEYWAQQYCPSSDIRLSPLVLTKSQVEEYQLPSIPIKDSDLRKANFQARYGTDATELDALEALHPGVLARILTDAATPYRDTSLAERLNEAYGEALDSARSAWVSATRAEDEELAEVKDAVDDLLSRYQHELTDLSGRLAEDMRPLAEQLEDIRARLDSTRRSLDVQLPERPQPEAHGDNGDEWLFDSGRAYAEQLRIYKLRKAGIALS